MNCLYLHGVKNAPFPSYSLLHSNFLKIKQPVHLFENPFDFRQARMKALQSCFPDIQEDEEQPMPRKIFFPKPISEPPSPTSTRPNSPLSSKNESENEDNDDSHDSEEEERELRDAVEALGVK